MTDYTVIKNIKQSSADRLCISPKDYIISAEIDPFFDLWVHVIKQAKKDKDSGFFSSDYCKYIVDLLNLDYDVFIAQLPNVLRKKVLKNE